MALPSNIPVPRLDQPRLIDGVKVRVFSPAKTIADCFKFRNKIGLDVALEALRDGLSQRLLTMDSLWHFATVDRVAKVMRPYLESVCAWAAMWPRHRLP